MSFSAVFHVKGSLVTDPRPHYKGGEVHVVHKLDADKWSFFEACGILKEDLGMSGKSWLWWKEKEVGFEDGLKRIKDDKDAAEVARYAITYKCAVDIYVESSVQGEIVVGVNSGAGEGSGKNEKRGSRSESKKGVGVKSAGAVGVNVAGPSGVKGQKKSGGVGTKKNKKPVEEVGGEESEDNVSSDGESSDNSVRDVHFSDSEEERMENLDDLFEVPTQESVQPVCFVSPKGIRRKSVPSRRPIGRGSQNTAGSRSAGTLQIRDSTRTGPHQNQLQLLPAPHGQGHGHDMEFEYHSEELDSEYDSSGGEDENRPKYVRYRKEEMRRDFKFKLGMEFGSLKEFKEAILEHSVLNGREIKFEKNDKML